MEVYDETNGLCPRCGRDDRVRITARKSIPLGAMLGERYLVGEKISDSESFHIYVGWDTVMLRKVVIKEYLPEKYGCHIGNVVQFISDSAKNEYSSKVQEIIGNLIPLVRKTDQRDYVTIHTVNVQGEILYIIEDYLEGNSIAVKLFNNEKMDVTEFGEAFYKLMTFLQNHDGDSNYLIGDLSNIFLSGGMFYITVKASPKEGVVCRSNVRLIADMISGGILGTDVSSFQTENILNRLCKEGIKKSSSIYRAVEYAYRSGLTASMGRMKQVLFNET